MGLSETPPLLLEAAGQCLFLAVQRQAFAPDAAKERAPLRLLPPPGFGLLRQAFHLAGQGRTGAIRSLGRAIVTSAPALFRGIGIIGTVAMLWVGGHILAVNLAKVGFDPLHRAIEWAGELAHNSVLSWVTGTAMSCFIGAAIGTLLALAWRPVHSALAGRRGL